MKSNNLKYYGALFYAFIRKAKYVGDGKMERDTERLALVLEKFKASAARHEEIR